MWNDPNYYFVYRYAAYIYNKILKTKQKMSSKAKAGEHCNCWVWRERFPFIRSSFPKSSMGKGLESR